MPLQGLKILDLSTWLTGAGGTALLADLGAEVIKVEHPSVGDATRAMTFTPEEHKRGVLALYELANRNKRGIAIDVKHPMGRAVLLRLAEGVDVVTENFRAGAMDRYGLGYDVLAARNPSVILVSANGFGPRGPDAANAVVDIMGHARSGMMRLLSDPTGPVRYIGAHAIADQTGAIFFAMAIMAGVIARSLHGHGQHIFTSQLGGLMTLQTVPIHVFLATGQSPWKELVGAQKPGRSGPYECADGRHICIWTPRQWSELCTVLKRIDLIDDPRFATPELRSEHDGDLFKELASAFKMHPFDTWQELFRIQGLPFSPVNDYEDLLADPQVWANGFIEEVDHPTAGVLRQLTPPFEFSVTKPRYRSAAPWLGQHTDEVLSECGYGAEEIAALRQASAIR